jgi:mono/diheme cytochrome c family protein
MRSHHLALTLVLTALGALACSKSNTSNGPTAAPEEQGGTTQTTSAGKVDMAAAREVFNSRCSACHGTSGRGDGPGAAALTPKPRNYTDATWQASVSDEQIKKTILLGGAAVGKSPIMPGSPDLDSKPEVVEGLVKIVRSFGK